MADFEKIIIWVLRQEDANLDGRVMNLYDGQGLTRFGVGQHSNPTISPTFYTAPVAEALEEAERIYREEYWNKIQGDLIFSDLVAATLMNFCVNDGVSRAVKMLQGCLNLPQDGIVGPTTIGEINSANETALAAQLREAQMAWYETCVRNQPTDARFLKGWLTRTNRIFPNL